MALELVTPLPPGAPSHTRLARHGARLVVLREILDGTDCSWPDAAPQLVTLQEVGELQGKRHALFPWVPGVTLRETLEALELVGSPVPLGLLGRVLIDAARALAAVSPARPHGGLQDGALQLGFDGQVSVLDYGAPRVTRFRPIGRVNFSADVFALGGVLHAALTGFQGPYATAPDTLPTPSRSHAEATVVLDDVVMRALSPEPDERQASAGVFADELEAVLGTDLFSASQLAEVVRTLFKDRIKLLQSLVDEGPSPDAAQPRPSAPVPVGTQPGVGGGAPPALGDDAPERTDIRAALKPQVPWESDQELDGVSDGTQPGVQAPTASQRRPSGLRPAPADDEGTRPRASAPSQRPRPPPPALDEAVAPTTPRAKAPPLDEAVEATNPGVRAPASRPADSAPELAPRTTPTELPEDTNPRALGTAALEDTAPRPRPSAIRAVATGPLPAESPRPRPSAIRAVDTGPSPAAPPRPRASAVRAADTGPLPAEPPRSRNTTEAERHRARGQERLRTPPGGVAAAAGEEEDDELRNEPTAVRSRVDPQRVLETAQKLPVVKTGGGGVGMVMVVLLLVVVGLAGAIGWKVLNAPPVELPFDEEVDASVPDSPEAAAQGLEPLALLAGLDGGPLDPDAGEEEEEEEEDLDGGVVDGGELAAGAGVDGGERLDGGDADAGPKPVKKVVKKKKRRRR